MKIQTTIEINQSIEQTWSLLTDDFTQIHNWFGPVHKAYELTSSTPLEGASCAGRICEFSPKPNSMKAVETITAWDKKNYCFDLHVEIANAPTGFPVAHNNARFALEKMDTGRTRFTILAKPKLKAHGYLLYPLLKLGLGKSFKDLSKAFKAHCESASRAAA